MSAAARECRSDAAAVALAGVVFVFSFLTLRSEAILWPHQGVHHVLTAGSLASGQGFEVVPGRPFAKFGPLYPVLLAPLAQLGVEVVPAVIALNTLGFALTLLALYLLARGLRLRAAWGL